MVRIWQGHHVLVDIVSEIYHTIIIYLHRCDIFRHYINQYLKSLSRIQYDSLIKIL